MKIIDNRVGLGKAAILLIAVLGIAGYFCYGAFRTHADSWGVCVTGLPDKVLAELANEDVPLYILKQTHEPLLRKDDGQNYASRILSSWHRSVDSRDYSFCLGKTARFDYAHLFSVNDLNEHLKNITPKYSRKFTIEQAGGCSVVKFNRRSSGYMDFLTMYENAPAIRKSSSSEVGLGEFAVDSIGKDKIILSRKEPIFNGYNKIVLYESSGDPAADFQRDDVADFNRISWREVPDKVLGRSVSFESIPLKSGGLVLTSPDRELRRLVYNCVDPELFRRAAFPHKKKLNDIASILPVGVPGAMAGKPAQVCLRKIAGSQRPVILAAVLRDNKELLEKFAESFRQTSGVSMKIKFYSAQELVKTLFTRPHLYDMVAISFSVVQPEYETFFKDFAVKDGFLDYDLPRLAGLREKLLKSEDEGEKVLLASKIADELIREAVVLPLYQEVRTFYYPAQIKNMMVGRGFTEYPEVSDFRW